MIEEFARRYGAVMDPNQVEIIMPSRAFETLVSAEHEYRTDRLARREEADIRAKSPAVAKAYEHYKMLLNLSR